MVHLDVLFEPLLHPFLLVHCSLRQPTDAALLLNQPLQISPLLPHFPLLVDHYPKKQSPIGEYC